MSIKLGSKDIPFIFQGDEVIYPDPIRDGLVLWYDFKAMSNAFDNRGVAKDLSGNGNDGELRNFNYTAESGYQDGGLKFDGVDDFVAVSQVSHPRNSTYEVSLKIATDGTYYDLISFGTDIVLRVYTYGEAMIIDKSKSPDRHSSSTSFDSNQAIVINYLISETGNKIFFNGEQVSDFTDFSFVQEVVATGFELGRLGGRIFDGSINSLKIYNRPLTPEEIQHNYQIEKARFNLGGDDL